MAIGLHKYVVSLVRKFNPNHGANGQFTSGGGGGATLRTDGAAALHRVLPSKIDSLTQQVDALPKDREIASQIAETKVHFGAALKSPTPKGSAQALGNAYMSLDRAANAVVGHKTPLAFQIKDIRTNVKFLEEALQRP